jgi:hypothetical protein
MHGVLLGSSWAGLGEPGVAGGWAGLSGAAGYLESAPCGAAVDSGKVFCVADKRRFELFAQFVAQQFPEARRVFDIAGGMGKLNEALSARGLEVTTFDKRWKHADVRYAERLFTLEEPCECDAVVGMHPDGATRIIVEYAAKHGVGFAIVPCCSDNGMPYKPWMRHLAELGTQLGLEVAEAALHMQGRSRVILGRPKAAILEPGLPLVSH